MSMPVTDESPLSGLTHLLQLSSPAGAASADKPQTQIWFIPPPGFQTLPILPSENIAAATSIPYTHSVQFADFDTRSHGSAPMSLMSPATATGMPSYTHISPSMHSLPPLTLPLFTHGLFSQPLLQTLYPTQQPALNPYYLTPPQQQQQPISACHSNNIRQPLLNRLRAPKEPTVKWESLSRMPPWPSHLKLSLNTNNWLEWSHHLLGALAMNQLDKYPLGLLHCPDISRDSVSHCFWNGNDWMILGYMRSQMFTAEVQYITSCTTSMDAFNQLCL
ncbi:hypothetical protein H4582DRAFT_2077330 [Lactarius indigo]|nr:hypothetical protein H4582DRAFT_2077330 [Lactarius indigo]